MIYSKSSYIYLFLYLIPIVLLLWFVSVFSVNVPFLDQWSLVTLFDKIAANKASIGDFFEQHNEHRLFFPSLIFAIFAFPSRWNVKLEMYFSISMAITSFYFLYKISENNQYKDKYLFHLFNVLTCIIFFSLLQFGNWLWGFQLAWYLINTCVILAVYILSVPKNVLPRIRLFLAALCCFIASFSSAHGLLSWLALVPAVAFIDNQNKPRKARLFIWVLFFLLCCAVYSIGYQKPAYTPDLFFFIKKPLATGAFLLMIVGSSIGSVINPAISGFFILLNFLFLNIYYVKNYRSEFAYTASSWLSLGWYGALFVLVVTISRVGAGIGQSLITTYTSTTVFLMISCLQMWRLLICHKGERFSKNVAIISGCYFLSGFLTAIFIVNSTVTIAVGRESWLQRTSGATCLEIIHYLNKSLDDFPDSCLWNLSYDFYKGILRDSASTLNRLGFRDSPRDIEFVPEPTKTYGSLNIIYPDKKVITSTRTTSIKISGWAASTDGTQQPRVVLLSYGANQSFFASAVVKLPRPDVGKQLNSGRYSRIGWDRFGWEVEISLKSLPVGETAIKAWVYNPSSKQFFKLKGQTEIKVIDQP